MKSFIKRNGDFFRVLAAFVSAELCSLILLIICSFFGYSYTFRMISNVVCILGVNAVVFLLFSKGVSLPEKSERFSRLELPAFFLTAVLLSCVAKLLTNPHSVSEGSGTPTMSVDILYAIYILLLAPVAEEIAFRGAVLTMLRSRSNIVAALASAAVFSLYHMSLSQIPYTFVLGFFLALIALRSGGLLPCILVHIANNALTLAVGWWEPLGGIVNFVLPLLGGISLLWLIITKRLFTRD